MFGASYLPLMAIHGSGEMVLAAHQCKQNADVLFRSEAEG